MLTWCHVGFFLTADRGTMLSSELLYFTWAPQGKGEQDERLSGSRWQEPSPALPHPPICNICKPMTCKLASISSLGGAPRDKANAAKFTFGQTPPTPNERSIFQLLNMIWIFYLLTYTWAQWGTLCVFLSWDHKDHNVPPCLKSRWITSTVCQSPVDMYLSWQFGLKFPLHVYKEQQEIPSEIKKWWLLDLFAPQGASLGGRFLQVAHSVISIFPRYQLLLLSALWNVLSWGSRRRKTERGREGGRQTNTQQRTITFQKLLKSHPLPAFLPYSSFTEENTSIL